MTTPEPQDDCRWPRPDVFDVLSVLIVAALLYGRSRGYY